MKLEIVPFWEVPELRLIASHSAPRSPDAGLPPHRHDFMEISYIRGGAVRWWAGNAWHDVSDGDVYVTRPHEPHGGDPRSLNGISIQWIQVALPAPGGDGSYLGLDHRDARHLGRALTSLRTTFKAQGDLAPYFDRIHGLIDGARDSLTVLMVRTAVIDLLGVVIQASRAQTHGAMSGMVQRARTLMDSNLRQPMPLPDVAAQLGCSLSTLKQRFKHEVGISPGRYYLNRRIKEACTRFEQTQDSVSLVAADLGFSSSQHLAGAFKQATGLTPTEFRDHARPWRTDGVPLFREAGQP